MIVAVSHAGDDHAGPVLQALRRLGAGVVLLDTKSLPARAVVALEHGRRAREWTLDGPTGRIRSRDVTAVWWRRPRPFEPEPSLSGEHAAFAVRQTYAALAGLAASLRVRWINEPWRDDAASQKPLQLAAAERMGFRVPRTLLSNDPVRARAFLRKMRGRAVHKAVGATREDWHPTRLVDVADLARLPAIRLAPVILQEYVPGVDVRVTVVGEKIFAAAIDARDTRSPEDFRLVYEEAKVEPCKLPGDVAKRVRALMKELGLVYGAIDLRRRGKGDYAFLEVNPSGQWLFVERRTGLGITEAVAKLLAKNATRF